jgi:Uma2 family endonuclease
MSAKEYLDFDRASQDARYEFIDGTVTMLAGGTINHSRISINLAKTLDHALLDKPCLVYNSDMRVCISASRYVYPDISISCDPRDQEQGNIDIIYHPCVIIEVLSLHTEAYDRSKKFSFYRSCLSVQEYVLVSSQEAAVDVYQRTTENLWTLHFFGPGDEVELKSINVVIPMTAIYERIKF